MAKRINSAIGDIIMKNKSSKNNRKKLMQAGTSIALAVVFTILLQTGFAVFATRNEDKPKSETVYAVLGDSGEYSGATVVNCFAQEGKIVDYGNYNEITNLMGPEKPTVQGQIIIWDASVTEGHKSFYYQGETQKPLPFNIAINYTLNGQPVKSSELAGKTGELKISFDIKNKAGTGETDTLVDREVYIPFAFQISFSIDSETFTILNVPKNASKLKLGSSYTLSHISFPLPSESFSFTLFGQDMTMDPINITVLPKAPPGLDSYGDFVNVDDMSEGTDDMISGAEDMRKGTEELLDALYTMKDEAIRMRDGLSDLESGAQKLESGTNSLYTNARALSSSTNDFYGTMSEFCAAFAAFDEGMETLSTSVIDMTVSLEGLRDGAALLNTGVNDMTNGVDSVKVSNVQLKALSDTIAAIYPDADTAALSAGLAAQQNAVDTLSASGDDLKTVAGTVSAGITDFYTEFSTTFGTNISTLRTSSGTLYASCLELLSGAESISDACEQLKSGAYEAAKGADGISSGTGEAANGVPKLIGAINEMIDGVKDLQDGIEELQGDGLSEMRDSLDGLDGYLQKLADEAKAYGSFMDSRNSSNSAVQFVLKTGGFSKDEETIPLRQEDNRADGFVKKLADLF